MRKIAALVLVLVPTFAFADAPKDKAGKTDDKAATAKTDDKAKADAPKGDSKDKGKTDATKTDASKGGDKAKDTGKKM